ncbi:tetratricopeptide repeat protein [Kitasatospora sp. NPDC018058]|uniref:tetratricopeptide repeat protein n=1 Tax=Kitasatospora sp. NPDC018058 TaxID=3364025 RepID=UPI0037C0BC86
MLRPHLKESRFAAALVDVTEGLGRDEEVAELLAAGIDAPAGGRPHAELGIPEPDDAVGLLAVVRERQGRVDEAVALLRTRKVTSVNGRDQLADLLARHERIEELRAYAAEDPLGDAATALAELLELRGDIEGAVDVHRAAAAQSPNPAVALAELLVRHGRGDEAIQVLRALPWAKGGDEDWIVHTLCTLYVDQRRAEEGLTYLDGVLARFDSPPWEYVRLRPRLLAACGRLEQAVEELRAGVDHPCVAEELATLLAGAGRPEEAVAVLGSADRPLRAALLVTLGRIDEAVALFHPTA